MCTGLSCEQTIPIDRKHPTATRRDSLASRLHTLQGGQKTMETDSDMLVQSNRFLLHSSRAHIRTCTARTCGRSETTATALLSSDSHTCPLKGNEMCSTTMRRLSVQTSQWISDQHGDADERATTMQRSLPVCHQLDDMALCATMSVYDLYALHCTSRRLCSPGHIRNTGVIDRGPWSRGFLIRPEESMVLTLHPSAPG